MDYGNEDGVFDVSLREKIQWESHKLDLFNLEVAKFRVKYGVSKSMIQLYWNMGRLCGNLITLSELVGITDNQWKVVVASFQTMLDKEEGDV